MNSLCPTNPKYNGRHACPQCGSESFWSCLDADKPRIRVECEKGCGAYEKAHSELRSLSFFEKPMTATFASGTVSDLEHAGRTVVVAAFDAIDR
jgi:hypothetical protein